MMLASTANAARVWMCLASRIATRQRPPCDAGLVRLVTCRARDKWRGNGDCSRRMDAQSDIPTSTPQDRGCRLSGRRLNTNCVGDPAYAYRASPEPRPISPFQTGRVASALPRLRSERERRDVHQAENREPAAIRGSGLEVSSSNKKAARAFLCLSYDALPGPSMAQTLNASQRPLRNPACLLAGPQSPYCYSIRAGFQRRSVPARGADWADM